MMHHQIFQNIATAHPDRDVVFIFHNDYFDRRDKYKGNYSYATELMKFTWSLTNNTLNQGFDFLVGDNLEETLVTAKLLGYKCAIIQTPGHCIRHNFLDHLTELRKQDWLLFAHILEKNDKLCLHDQCIILNLENLDNDEMNPGDRNETKLMPLYDRSDENFHDGHTPLWVKFNGEYATQKTMWGWRWIAKGLVNSQILTFTDEIRNSKIHLYPENEGNYEGWYRENDTSQLAKIAHQMSSPDSRRLHLYNNETVPPEMIRRQTNQSRFDNIVVLASGFYGMKMAKEFAPNKIVYYDIMSAMLDVNKRVNDTWDGTNDLAEFVTDGTPFHSPTVPKHNIYNEGIFKEQTDVTSYLPEFRNIDKEYHQVDIISDPELFLSLLPTTGSTYVWLDSIYTYWANLWQYRPREIAHSYQVILDGIRKHDNDIWVHVKDPDGYIRVIHNKTFDSQFAKQAYASNFRTWS
tara:strand:- start:983 stop:2371 length:1389 start_codon:yes stop_codon:yes gene_type:complete